jgi:hypothetical protein
VNVTSSTKINFGFFCQPIFWFPLHGERYTVIRGEQLSKVLPSNIFRLCILFYLIKKVDAINLKNSKMKKIPLAIEACL